MLNRRYLRVKVLQALYAYLYGGGKDVPAQEKELFKSIEEVRNLYLLMLQFVLELKTSALNAIEQAQQKKLATEEDLNPSLRFVSSPVFKALEESAALQKEWGNRKTKWDDINDLPVRTFRKIKDDDIYLKYLAQESTTLEDDKQVLIELYKEHVWNNEAIEQHLEEQNIYWGDDLDLVNVLVVKTISGLSKQKIEKDNFLLELYKDKKDDPQFVKDLLEKTIINHEEYETIIANKANNWDVDRIAAMDILLMKMALCEFEHFKSVPIKVTMNEYIELSKSYSTSNSKAFVNGILDKIVPEWKAQGKIKKAGRGLIEN